MAGSFVAAVAVIVTAVALTGGSGSADARGGNKMVRPATPRTPSVKTLTGTRRGNTRTFRLTASEFTQKLANFPISKAKVWGYNGSTPGPTLLVYKGERLRVIVTNKLPPTQLKPDMPAKPTFTTVHFHGAHAPNSDDGVAGISEPDPIPPGGTHTYSFTPRHAGTLAYHSHTDGAVQELRGLDGFLIVRPRRVKRSQRVDRDYAMVLQQFAPPGEGQLVAPFPPGTGDFPISTINGKTGEAAGRTLDIRKGDLVRIRLYNASNLSHSMHLHGHDFVVVSKNGHTVPHVRETTQNVAPGDFFEIEFRADNPGNWIFHCHVPHHTTNKMMSGYHGAPVGMTRIFHYKGYKKVRKAYFDYHG